ncbi:hypothetical protein GF325_07080 [Candidatus Bathyarchaeota archaeon]|nr:hypothetical protein [Candidatus Bathyarchaeota archaeon]
MRDFEVIVVGAGPAGISAAFFFNHLSNAKLDTCLVERLPAGSWKEYHRKCREGVSMGFFEDIHPIEKQHVINEIHHVHECWGGEIETIYPSCERKPAPLV